MFDGTGALFTSSRCQASQQLLCLPRRLYRGVFVAAGDEWGWRARHHHRRRRGGSPHVRAISGVVADHQRVLRAGASPASRSPSPTWWGWALRNHHHPGRGRVAEVRAFTATGASVDVRHRPFGGAHSSGFDDRFARQVLHDPLNAALAFTSSIVRIQLATLSPENGEPRLSPQRSRHASDRPNLAVASIVGLFLPRALEAQQVYERGEGITMPKVTRDVKPQYTKAAMDARIEGNVEMSAVILEDGSVGEVKVTKSLDTEYGLDEAAVTAIKQWQFAPGQKDGTPVAVRVDVEMSFRLK